MQAFDLLNRGARSARAGEVQPKVGDAVGEPQTTTVVGDEVTGLEVHSLFCRWLMRQISRAAV